MSVTAPGPPLETVTRTAPFGVLFWDPVTGRAVLDGLVLTETRTGAEGQPTASGALAFHDLPGLSPSAFGVGDTAYWASPPGLAQYRFQLLDLNGSYIPFSFDAAAPHQGLFTADFELAGSPPGPVLAAIPLFSSPSRIAPGGAAVVRAQLWDATANAPAAAAVLEITVATPRGGSYRGIADEAGRAAVLFPCPEPIPAAGTSPPGGGSLAQQTWPLTATVSYGGMASPPAAGPPDIRTVLEQPAAELRVAGPSAAAVASVDATLSFGVDLVLRTTGQSVLLVLPT
jgi:hypothetical protein